MDKEVGRSPSGRAAAADAVEPLCGVSSKASIPNAWQPIETAPEFKIVAVATYEKWGYWRAFGAAQLVGGRWLHCLGDHIPAPTHWLPLPYGPSCDEYLYETLSERTGA